MPSEKAEVIGGVLGGILAAAGANAAFQRIAQSAGAHAAEMIKAQIGEDKRGELLVDLSNMQPEDKNVLIRRHRDATRNMREARFVTLLTKIPKEERRAVLKYLNGVSDAEFEQMLYLLEHDNFTQWMQRVRQNGWRVATHDWDVLRGMISSLAETALKVAHEAIAAGNEVAGKAAPVLNEFADWLEDFAAKKRSGRS